VYRVARRNAVQTFYHIRGNILNDVGTRYHGKEFWLARAYAQFMHMASKFLSRRMPTMVVGSELFDLYSPFSSNIFQISPSLIKNSDIDLSERLFSTKEFGRRDVINLLFVGRLEPEKGLEFLFSAMRDFNDNSSVPCNLTIVGTAQKGSEGKEIIIRERARQLGLSDSITWKGYVAYGNDLLNIYRNADIFVLPSLAEGIPKVLYEAMATGVPIICSKVGGIPDVITHSKNGLLISPGSSTELYSAIQELAGSPNLRATLIQAGFETVREHTSEKARDQIVRILEQCGIALPVTNEHQGN
jgi:glycosyltransferase involved in cell wall biosynthesis